MNHRSRQVRNAAVALAAATIVASPALPARASDPSNVVDPAYEGSLLDTRNIAAAAASDLSSSPGATVSGCASSATSPQKRPDPGSPTGEDVYAAVFLAAAGPTVCSETWTIQRTRWYGWESNASTSVTVGGPGGAYEGTIAVYCAAGTWSYRVVAASGYHTASARFTCTNIADPFYIDQT